MTGEETQYEVTEIKAIRGTEAKTITSKQQEGWELVAQQQGHLRTTITFRRPNPKTPWRLWGGLGAAGVIVLAGIITIGALQEDASDASTTEAVAASSAEQPSPQLAPEPVAEPAAPEKTEILTIDNNQDLARILHDTDNCGHPVADFATQYADQTIQFDGHIAAMNNHGNYKTRYDILIGARDFDESDAGGPAFQFRDVNIVSDLRLTGPDIPDTLGVKDTLRVTAVVEEFEEKTCLLQLYPVSTEIR
ncbi:DUF4839 domain-containing protein [Rhodococcus qingshengii]|uniref:DUF4839 domain-containing protein n=1 Tax=Rhodococcus qingshengii TaxID=334542 RepID=UPI001BE93A58|nr:DUF4839 domain-containing protein [Rhodococcus qingshengii]MBT2273218.1 DUF4839 domain-containing protein [Rhodococcus qingshengii]